MPNTSNDDVIIVGSLSDKELRDSIDKLVDYVGDKTTIMAGKFDVAMEKMKSAMKDFATTQKVSVDLMQDAWKQMSASFDAMLKAQQNATSSGNNSGTGGGNSQYADNTVGHLQEIIALEEKRRKEMTLGSVELDRQNILLEKRRKLLKEETSSPYQKIEKSFSKEFGVANSMSAKTLQQAEDKLKRLIDLQNKFKGSGLIDETKMNRLQKAIDGVTDKITKLRNAKPKSLKDVLGMDESSVDSIAKKMAALKKVTVDPQNTAQVSQLGNEYQRLSRLQAELMGQNIQMTHSNNYLAQSFGYIRNRLVYAMTLGAATSFVKQVYDIRSQYELLERSLGVLVNSFERGSQIFRELNSMALKSPFTLMELAGAAKQLVAYNFEANEVVNTTRRLADLSAALGVPMERLTYNLGQIRAQTVLTARDARDFANAGLPIVPALADYFTELEGKVVSTGDVYDRMSKKMVSYSDVMSVLNKMTDEGGKFFDFQAKQAETLRVQLANLTLAWNNMLNEIGEANQGILTAPISLLKSLFQHWQSISRIITEVVVGLGAYKAAQMIVTATIGTTAKVLDATILRNKKAIAAELERKAITERLTVSELRLIATQNQVTAADYRNALSTKNLTKEKALFLVALNRNNVALQQALIRMGLLTAAEVRSMTAGRALKLVMDLLGLSIKRTGMAISSFFAKNAWLIAISALVEVFMAYKNSAEQVAEINKNVANSAKESFESITEYLNNYSNVLDRLYKQRKSDSEGNIDMTRTDIPEEEATRAWEAMRKKIIESTAASNSFLTTLEAEADMSERLRQGFDILTELQSVESVLRDMKDDAIDISTTDLWGLAGEGLSDDLKDFIDIFDKYHQLTENARQGTRGESVFNEMKSDLKELNAEIQVTAASLAKFTQDKNFSAIGQREAFEKTIQSIADKEQLSVRETRILRIKSEEEYYAAAKTLLEQQIANSVGQNKIALQERLKDLETEFNANKTIQETFFTWLQEHQQSEVQRRFRDMTKEEIAHIDWSKKEWEQWAEKLARDFSNEYGTSFNDLSNLVKKANTWSINIPVYFNTVGKKVSDIVEDYEKRTGKRANSEIQNAKTQLEIIESLRDQQSKLEKQITAAEKAGGSYWEKNKEKLNEQNQDLISQIHAYNALTKSEEDAQNKKNGGRKNEKDVVAEALKQELQLIREMQSNYDKLRKSGVSNMDAIDLASKGYEATIIRINQVLSKFGIDKFNAANFTGKDVRSLLQSLEEQRKALLASGKVKTSSLQALDVEIQKLTVDAKTYDMKKVTDGLNSELGKIKDEYELAVELDANPELGGIFADMMGIDEEQLKTLPRTFNQVVAQLQASIDKLFADNNIDGSFDLTQMLDKGDFDKWVTERGNTLDDNFVEALNEIREYANKVRLDETKETTKNWSQLIDKYGQLQYRLVKIAKDATKEIKNIINKFGNDEQKQLALDLANKISISQDPSEIARLQEQLRQLLNQVTQGNEQAVNINTAVQNQQNQQTSKAYWEDFKNSDYYTMMFEDMSRNSTRAIQLIIDKMNELKDKVKEDPASMKALSKSLQDAQKELESRSSTVTILGALKEMRTAYDEVATARKNLANADKEVGDAEKALESSNGDADKTTAAVERLRIARERQKQATLDAANAETKYRAASKKLQSGMETLSGELQNVQNIFGAVAKLFAAVGDDETVEAINAISEGFSIMTTIIMGVVAAMVLLESTQPWLLAIAGALSVIVGLVSWLSGGKDKEITNEVKKSEIAVKRLENSYKNLEKAVNEAFGASEITARKAEIANKKLQLAELQRQLQLERSRDSKKRDEGKIADLEGQIIDLKNEIKDMKNNITNSFLGISSVKDAVGSMMDDIVDALRNGEDAMGSFNDSIDDMIANMIKQVFSARILGPMFNEIWDRIDADIQRRGEQYADYYAEHQEILDHIDTATNNTGDGYHFWKDQSGRLWASNSNGRYLNALREGAVPLTYKVWHALMQARANWALEQLEKATTPTMDDVHRFGTDLRQIAPEIEGYMVELENILREMGLIKDTTSEEALSKLQQGIQGVTEDTAGAIEAYMNIVAQRVFEQNLYLQEIRDHLNNFDLDVQLGTLSQMLLQLQQSYQVQQNIESILTGVLNPSGRAIVVELNS